MQMIRPRDYRLRRFLRGHNPCKTMIVPSIDFAESSQCSPTSAVDDGSLNPGIPMAFSSAPRSNRIRNKADGVRYQPREDSACLAPSRGARYGAEVPEKGARDRAAQFALVCIDLHQLAPKWRPVVEVREKGVCVATTYKSGGHGSPTRNRFPGA